MNCAPSGILLPVTVICRSALAWFDGGTIRRSLDDCRKCYPAKVCYLHESENNGDFIQ